MRSRTPSDPIFRPPSMREARQSEVTWRAWSWLFFLRRDTGDSFLFVTDAMAEWSVAFAALSMATSRTGINMARMRRQLRALHEAGLDLKTGEVPPGVAAQ